MHNWKVQFENRKKIVSIRKFGLKWREIKHLRTKTQIMKSWFPPPDSIESLIHGWLRSAQSIVIYDWLKSKLGGVGGEGLRSRRWWRLSGVGGTRLRVIEHNVGGGWCNRQSCDWNLKRRRWSRLTENTGDTACCRQSWWPETSRAAGEHTNRSRRSWKDPISFF